MQKFKNSFLLLVLAAVCLPQTATQLVTPEIRRVGDKLACRCGVCNNTVATCQMLECHYSLPARQKFSTLCPSTSLGPVHPFGDRKTIIGQRGRVASPFSRALC